MADLGPAVAGPADAGIFLVAVALQRQPYLSVDNLRPTGGEVLGLALLRSVSAGSLSFAGFSRFADLGIKGLRGEGVKGSTNYLRGVHGDRGVRFWGLRRWPDA